MLNKFICLLAVLLLFALPAQAADVYNQNTKIHADGETYVIYKVGLFDMATGTDDFYSKAMFIGDMNATDGMIQVTVSNETGTEDIDITYEFSFDNQTWTASAADDELTQIGNGGVTLQDTLGIIDGVDHLLFHTAPLMRIHVSGEAGNPNGTDVTIFVTLHKGDLYYEPGQTLPDVRKSN